MARKPVAWISGFSLIALLAAQAAAQTPFYQGKTITLVQGVAAGGTGDLRRKVLIPYLRKYIPGSPAIVSDHMPGGGDRKAGNFLFRNARPDGLTIGGVSASLIMNAILDNSGVQYDIDKFIYLGTPISAFHYVILTRKEAGLPSLEKLRSAPALRFGAQEVGHDTYIVARMAAYLLAMKDAKFVTGYGGPEVDIALERGEVDARASAAETILQRNIDWLDKGLVDLHLMLEVPKGNKLARFAALTSFDDFAKTERDHRLLNLYRTFRMVGTPYLLPPGTPKAQVQILQEAMRSALKDPGFHADFKKLSGFEASPLMPEGLEKSVRQLPRDPEVVELFKQIAGANPLPGR